MCIRDRAKTVYRGHDSGAGCAGSNLVSGLNGDAVTYCFVAVSYTHLRAHETPEHLVCRLLLEKKN